MRSRNRLLLLTSVIVTVALTAATFGTARAVQPGPVPDPTQRPSRHCTDAHAYRNWDGERYVFHDTSQSVRTTDGWGSGGMGLYYADAGMWNVGSYSVDQHTTFCGPHSFYVRNSSDDRQRDGAVKSYPNIHMDTQYLRVGTRPWGRYHTISSTFAHHSPGRVGIYDVAYDVWFDGLGIELMVWTENSRQRPGGSVVGQLRWEGTTWQVWTTRDHSYTALVPIHGGRVTSGSYQFEPLFRALSRMTRSGSPILPASARLTQLDYGVEIVSTGGTMQRWDFTHVTIAIH